MRWRAVLRAILRRRGVTQAKWWPWTRDFIRDFGWGEYWRVVIRDANLYRLRNWRCWFGHDLGEPEAEYEDWYRVAEWQTCCRPGCEYAIQVYP